MSSPIMPRDHACDALEDAVSDFCNYMVRRGVKELPAREWMEEFRSWLAAYDFEQRYEDTLKWLGERP